MRTLWLLPFLLILVWPSQNPSRSEDGSSVVVLNFKWARSRQTIEKLDEPNPAPAAAMTSANKNFERNRRANDPAGVRDPNADTLDGRSAALDKSVQEARAPKPKPVDGYAYRVKVQNASAKVIEVMFWEYQFKEKSNPTNVARRQFLCGVNIKPDKEKELQAFSASGPSDVISVANLGNKAEDLFEEKVVINRVEYADGSIWQRKDWNYAEVKLAIAWAIGTPWGTEMCRGL
ncbi:MAG TPA: hypothetical protein VGC89_11105 [Pyrinomonadaceae bacterium]